MEAQGNVAMAKPPKTLGRDRRLLAIFALCTGGGVAQCLLYSQADLRGGLTVAAAFKMIQAVSRNHCSACQGISLRYILSTASLVGDTQCRTSTIE